MKRVLKIIGLTLAAFMGLIIVAAIIVYIFFPGLPVLVNAKMTLPSLDTKLDKFDSNGVLDHAREVVMQDYSFSVPDSCTWRETDTLTVYEDVNVNYAVMASKYYADLGPVPPIFSQANMKAFAKYFGGKIPKNIFECEKFEYGLTPSNFILSDVKQCAFCYKIALLKDMMLTTIDKISYYEHDNIRGFIFIRAVDPEKGLVVFQFFCTDNLSRMYQIGVKKTDDRNLIDGTINSVRFNKQP